MRFFHPAPCGSARATPPSRSRLDRRVLRAVARQKLDVLDRQIELVLAGVMDLQAIVWRASRLDRLQPDEAADAMVDVDHEVAGRQTRQLGDEIVGALRRLARPHQAVAEDVLLDDDRGVGGLEARLQAERRQPDLRRAAAPAAVRASRRTFTRLKMRCSLQHVASCGGSRAPSLHSAMVTRLPAPLQRLDVSPHGVRTRWRPAAGARAQKLRPARVPVPIHIAAHVGRRERRPPARAWPASSRPCHPVSVKYSRSGYGGSGWYGGPPPSWSSACRRAS